LNWSQGLKTICALSALQKMVLQIKNISKILNLNRSMLKPRFNIYIYFLRNFSII